jgi:hypothetical protein
MLNMICRWVEDPNSEAFKLHTERIYDFLWVAEDGMKMKVLTSSSAFRCDFFMGTCINFKLRWRQQQHNKLILNEVYVSLLT